MDGQEAPGAHGFVQVAIERGVDRYPDGLTYAVPASLADLREGDRVSVPLGRGHSTVEGYVVQRGGAELLGSLEAARTKYSTIKHRHGMNMRIPLIHRDDAFCRKNLDHSEGVTFALKV